MLIFIILFSSKTNANDINNQTFSKIDKYINSIQNKTNIPIISIGIVKNDSLIYKKSYSKNKSPSHPSLFYIGSLTKSFTALAIMQLVEEKKINLDYSIEKYLPWFKIKDMNSINNITIRTLLNQTSGFSTYEGLKNFNDWDNSDLALEKTIRNLKNTSLVSKPSTTFHYSNINYQILGLIIEKVSNLSYEQYIKKNIFDKLDMKNSFTSLDNIDKTNIAQGHRLWFNQAVKSNFPFSKILLPAGYIISNVDDMSKYLIAQLNNGKYIKEQIYSSSTIKQIQTPSATIIKNKTYYSFGWFVDTSKELNLNHLGSAPGYTSVMIIFPKEKLGLIVLTNVTSYTLGNKELNSLAGGIIDIIKNRKIKDNSFDLILISAYLLFSILLVFQLYLFIQIIKKNTNISKYIIFLIFDIIVVIAIYFIIPRLYDLNLSVFLIFAPDIGYIMVGSIIIAILDFILRSNFFISNHIRKR